MNPILLDRSPLSPSCDVTLTRFGGHTAVKRATVHWTEETQGSLRGATKDAGLIAFVEYQNRPDEIEFVTLPDGAKHRVLFAQNRSAGLPATFLGLRNEPEA